MLSLILFAAIAIAPEKKVTPPRPDVLIKSSNSGFVVDGKKFKSIKEWKASKEYNNMRILQEMDVYLEPFNDTASKLENDYNLRIIKQFNKDRTTANMNYIIDQKRIRGRK